MIKKGLLELVLVYKTPPVLVTRPRLVSPAKNCTDWTRFPGINDHRVDINVGRGGTVNLVVGGSDDTTILRECVGVCAKTCGCRWPENSKSDAKVRKQPHEEGIMGGSDLFSF